MLTPREKSPLPEKNLLRGGSNPRRRIKQDSELNTLPTNYTPSPQNEFKSLVQLGQDEREANPDLSALEADALPLSHQGGLPEIYFFLPVGGTSETALK